MDDRFREMMDGLHPKFEALGSRKAVASTDDFIREFSSAKKRVRGMNYRYV